MPRTTLLLATSLACACGFSATAAVRPALMRPATSQLVMKAPVQEEKKTGLAALFGGSKTDGKVVPTKNGKEECYNCGELDCEMGCKKCTKRGPCNVKYCTCIRGKECRWRSASASRPSQTASIDEPTHAARARAEVR